MAVRMSEAYAEFYRVPEANKRFADRESTESDIAKLKSDTSKIDYVLSGNFFNIPKGATVTNVIARNVSCLDQDYDVCFPTPDKRIRITELLDVCIKQATIMQDTGTVFKNVVQILKADTPDFYGGYIDLKEKKYYQYIKKKVFNGTENWVYHQATESAYPYLSLSDTAEVKTQSFFYDRHLKFALCDAYPITLVSNTINNFGIYIATNGYRIYDPDFESASAFKAYLAENPITLYYSIREPVIYNIKDSEISGVDTTDECVLIAGQNNARLQCYFNVERED